MNLYVIFLASAATVLALASVVATVLLVAEGPDDALDCFEDES